MAKEDFVKKSWVQTSDFMKARGWDARGWDPRAGRAALGSCRVAHYVVSGWEGVRDRVSLHGILEARFQGLEGLDVGGETPSVSSRFMKPQSRDPSRGSRRAQAWRVIASLYDGGFEMK